jgi:hypothetical protein
MKKTYKITVTAHITYASEIEAKFPVEIVVEAENATEAGDKGFIAMKEATLAWSGWDRSNLIESE